MAEPKAEWAKRAVQQVDNLVQKMNKVETIMMDLQRLSVDHKATSDVALRAETRLEQALKTLDDIAQDVKGFSAFKATGETIVGWLKWLFTGTALAALAAIVAGVEVRSSVAWQRERLDKLEARAEKFQEATSQFQEATKKLAQNAESNAAATKKLAEGVEAKMQALTPSTAGPAKANEDVMRTFLTYANYKKAENGADFLIPLLRPIDKVKAQRAHVAVRLGAQQSSSFEQPALLDMEMQFSANLSEDGRICRIQVLAKDPGRFDAYLKGKGSVSLELVITTPQ